MQSEIDYPIPQWVKDTLPKRRWILEYVKKNGKGAELGVFRGVFSEFLLTTVQPELYYMVDGWELLFGDTFAWGGDYTCNGTLPTMVAKSEAIERTSSHKNRHVVTSTTTDFLNNLGEQLDFFYIDATHKYYEVLAELKLIHQLDLLAPGGTIIGDDWVIDPNHHHHGVCRAVNDFVKSSPYQIVAAHQPSRQWAIRKTPEYS